MRFTCRTPSIIESTLLIKRRPRWVCIIHYTTSSMSALHKHKYAGGRWRINKLSWTGNRASLTFHELIFLQQVSKHFHQVIFDLGYVDCCGARVSFFSPFHSLDTLTNHLLVCLRYDLKKWSQWNSLQLVFMFMRQSHLLILLSYSYVD